MIICRQNVGTLFRRPAHPSAAQGGPERALRLDLALANAALRELVRDVWVDRDARRGDGPSDHAPLVVDLEPAVIQVAGWRRTLTRRRTGSATNDATNDATSDATSDATDRTARLGDTSMPQQRPCKVLGVVGRVVERHVG